MNTVELNTVTRVTVARCPVPENLHKFLIETDLGRVDGARSKTQIFLTTDEFRVFLKSISDYAAENI